MWAEGLVSPTNALEPWRKLRFNLFNRSAKHRGEVVDLEIVIGVLTLVGFKTQRTEDAALRALRILFTVVKVRNDNRRRGIVSR